MKNAPIKNTPVERVRRGGVHRGEGTRLSWLVACLVGVILGVSCSLVVFRLGRFRSDDEVLDDQNRLLVTQQLEGVYSAIQTRLQEHPQELPAFTELLQVYYAFDRRFVRQNERTTQALAESTYASQRMAHSALVLGDLQKATSHFHRVREGLGQMVVHQPSCKPFLYRDALETQSNLVLLAVSSGDSRAAESELQQVIDLVADGKWPLRAGMVSWFAPHIKELARVGIRLGRCTDALTLAGRYRDVATSVGTDLEQQDAMDFLEQMRQGCGAHGFRSRG